MKTAGKTFEQIAADESGTIYHDEYRAGLRFIVMRGPASLCAYVGIPKTHPLADHSYDDLPVDCHGGLTFSGEGDGKFRPVDYWWYGWDYGHAGDRSFYELKYPDWPKDATDKVWTVADIIEDSWSALYGFEKLLRLTEKICRRVPT